MGWLELVAESVGVLDVSDIPGGTSILGDYESLIPFLTPIAEGRDPNLGDAIDLLEGVSSLPGGAPFSTTGTAGETLETGVRNVGEYNRRTTTDIGDQVEEARKGIGNDDPRRRGRR